MKRHHIPFIIGTIVLVAASIAALAGQTFTSTEFMNSVSAGTWSAVSNPAVRYTTGGIYTNSGQTNYYRVSGTNRRGRLPLSTVVTNTWTGTTNASNAVIFAWELKDGLINMVVEMSTNGSTWTNWTTVGAQVTNYTDYGTNTWTGSSYTGSHTTIITTPAMPWATATIELYVWTNNTDARGYDLLNVDNVTVSNLDLYGDAQARGFDLTEVDQLTVSNLTLLDDMNGAAQDVTNVATFAATTAFTLNGTNMLALPFKVHRFNSGGVWQASYGSNITSALTAGNRYDSIVMGPGVYLVTNKLSYTTNLTISGAGPGVTTLKPSTSAGAWAQAPSVQFYHSGESVISDMTITGGTNHFLGGWFNPTEIVFINCQITGSGTGVGGLDVTVGNMGGLMHSYNTLWDTTGGVGGYTGTNYFDIASIWDVAACTSTSTCVSMDTNDTLSFALKNQAALKGTGTFYQVNVTNVNVTGDISKYGTNYVHGSLKVVPGGGIESAGNVTFTNDISLQADEDWFDARYLRGTTNQYREVVIADDTITNADVMVNGSFTSSVYWTFTNCSIVGGKVVVAFGVTNALFTYTNTSALGILPYQAYMISYDKTTISSFETIETRFGGRTNTGSASASATIEEVMPALTTGGLSFFVSAPSNSVTIDNVKVQQLPTGNLFAQTIYSEAYMGNGAGLTNIEPRVTEYANGTTNTGTIVMTAQSTYYPITNFAETISSSGITFTNYGVQLTGVNAPGIYEIVGSIAAECDAASQSIHIHIARGNNGVTNEVLESIGNSSFFRNVGESYTIPINGMLALTNSHYLELVIANDTSASDTLTIKHVNMSMHKISE